jgi:pantoate ligase/cytidylate kinase
MIVIKTIAELRSELAKLSPQLSVGFVPTMGALHLGHESLIKRGIRENDLVIVSIFVNPLQFGKNEDLAKYPRQFEQDRQICTDLGVKILFAPSVEEMTPNQQETTIVVPPESMMSVLCGKYRPGHFQGVATIVTKLLNLVRPTVAYFGQKDAQQVAIIQRMVRDLAIPVQIKPCPIIREESGLAYSSRNQYLTPAQKQDACTLYRSLKLAKQAFDQGETQADTLIKLVSQELTQTPTIRVQYIELVHPETLTPLTEITESGLLAIACYLGNTRLIDNLVLTRKKPIIAIDGPAGAGKSTISRRVAQSLGLLYLDTGAMYRAMTWLVLQSNLNPEDGEKLANLVDTAKLELFPAPDLQSPTRVIINDHDVTQAIRTPEVTANVSKIAALEVVRQKLVAMQQEYGERGGIVMEGRDIGTNVFPDAELKIFLTASVEERARRRALDLENQGLTNIDILQLQQEIAQRDHLDSTREIAPLIKAEDAIEVITDGLTIEQVTEKIVNLYGVDC